MSTPFDERWLKTGACVPVDIETMAALVSEIHRLIDVIGGMALAKREWVGLTDEERDDILGMYITAEGRAKAIEAKLKEKNT